MCFQISARVQTLSLLAPTIRSSLTWRTALRYITNTAIYRLDIMSYQETDKHTRESSSYSTAMCNFLLLWTRFNNLSQQRTSEQSWVQIVLESIFVFVFCKTKHMVFVLACMECQILGECTFKSMLLVSLHHTNSIFYVFLYYLNPDLHSRRDSSKEG